MTYLFELDVGDYIKHNFLGEVREGWVKEVNTHHATFGPGEDDTFLFDESDAPNVTLYKKEDYPEYFL